MRSFLLLVFLFWCHVAVASDLSRPIDVKFKLEQGHQGKYFCAYIWAYDTRCGYAYEYVDCNNIPRKFNWCSDSKYQYDPKWCKLISDACSLVCQHRSWWPPKDGSDPVCYP